MIGSEKIVVCVLVSLQFASVLAKMRNERLFWKKTINLPHKRSKRQVDPADDIPIVPHDDPHSFFRQTALHRMNDDGDSVATEDMPDKVAILGRPFRLGNFYDARTGNLIVAASPWSHATLQNTTEAKVEKTEFTSTDSNKLETDMMFFGMDSSLQAQFLHGAVKVSGSASFLKQERKSNRIVRAIMQYEDVSKFVTLQSGTLNKVDFPETLRRLRGVATHVVTGIEQGTRAVMVFERKLADGENRIKANAELFAQVKKIAQTDFDENGHINITKEEFGKIKNCTAKFYGDFILDAPPTDYWEALELYYKLPNIMETAREHPTGLTAYMFPLKKLFEFSNLTNLDPAAHQNKVSEVPKDVRDQLLDLFETIDDIQREINSIRDRPVTRFHRRIFDQLTIFENHLDMYETHLKTEFAPLVPLIIQGHTTSAKAEREVRKLIEADAEGPFSAQNMRKWMQEKEEEVEVLMAKIDLPNRCIHEAHFSSVLHHHTCTYTCALVLKIGHYKDKYLEILNEYLDTKKPAVFEYEGKSDDLLWWDPDDETQSAMFKKANDLQEWIRLEERRAKTGLTQKVNFAIREVLLKEDESPHVKLQLYRDGSLLDGDYQIPGRPGKPEVIAKGSTWVRLSWPKPTQGASNIGGYEIETLLSNATVHNSTEPYHQSVLDTCGKFFCQLRADFAYEHEDNKLEDLEPGTEYRFRVVVYSKYHHASAMSQVSDPVITKYQETTKRDDEL